uniref:integrator complex subunit 4 n=1 Tax=Myxine glutinosa TaxID=7769 RepID=UPI00358FD580
MAAHLKKRVYEEFSKVVQEEPTTVKRLRLSKPSKSAALHQELSRAQGSAEALQLLLRFARKPVEPESVEGVVRILLEHFYKESDTTVRLKVSSLLSTLVQTPAFSADSVLDDVIMAITSEKSHQVKAQLMEALQAIGLQQPVGSSPRQRILTLGCKQLCNSSHSVRSRCLQLLGNLGSVEAAAGGNATGSRVIAGMEEGAAGDVQGVVAAYLSDQDARVRSSAIGALMLLHDRGLKLQQAVYSQACQAMTDDHEDVRSATIRLVWLLSQIYPSSMLPVQGCFEEIRLVDDAFGKICQMVNDSSMDVRVQAVKLLGSMERVSAEFLEQTLDKKLMSDLKRKRSAHERAKELFSSGEFSSGRRWGDDCPREAVDRDAACLISSGACGAFVHGLEDELYEVRMAAVDSLCQLARASQSFAVKSLDFLVDMFNDEIEEVRLQSIHALRLISQHITLRDDQLDIVLAVLEDSSRDIREAVHELLCVTNVSTKSGLHLALLELLKNLDKYPSDRHSIWRCLQHLGQRHPNLVLPLVPVLLSTHPYFDSPEPNVDDPSYVGVLVMVFNAGQLCPTLGSLLPSHTLRHYAYLRDSLSHLVPPLSLEGGHSGQLVPGVSTSTRQDAQRCLQSSLDRVRCLRRPDTPGACELLRLTIRDLKSLGELVPDLKGAAEFSALYLGSQLLLTQALQDPLWTLAAPLFIPQNAVITHSVSRVLEDSSRLEFLFEGLGPKHVAGARQLRVQAQALRLVLQARSGKSEEPLPARCERFLQEVEDLHRCLEPQLGALPGGFAERLFESMPFLSTSKPNDIIRTLGSLLRQAHFIPLEPPMEAKRASAEIIEPSGESDNPLKFTAGLVLGLDLDASIHHVSEPHLRVRVQVVYPDGQSQIIHPRAADFRNPSPGLHRLVTQVYLSHSAWTEPCEIEISLLLNYSTANSISPPSCASSPAANCTESFESLSLPFVGSDPTEGSLPLCAPTRVLVAPKPPRR